MIDNNQNDPNLNDISSNNSSLAFSMGLGGIKESHLGDKSSVGTNRVNDKLKTTKRKTETSDLQIEGLFKTDDLSDDESRSKSKRGRNNNIYGSFTTTKKGRKKSKAEGSTSKMSKKGSQLKTENDNLKKAMNQI